jgi:hypothetical protein
MKQGIRQQLTPALALSMLALFVALGGSVYAAARINGRAVRVKSLPGNRLKPRSVPANRLKPGVLKGTRVSGPLTGAEINELTLGQVPSAAHADFADSAQSAVDAQTALNAVNAVNASNVNGYSAGCREGTIAYAGACWEASASEYPATAADAAAACGDRGGTLPPALELAAFSQLPGVALDAGGEWSGNVTTFSGPNAYAIAMVLDSGVVDVELSTEVLKFRCVIPLVA